MRPMTRSTARAGAGTSCRQNWRGFRRFSLRGVENVRREWKLVCLASNLLKLFGSGWTPQTA